MTEEQQKEHFERMQMMCRTFQSAAEKYADFQPEFIASKSINDILQKSNTLTNEGFIEILKILTDIDLTKHKDGSQWYDYKIHLNALLGQKGYDSNIF